jgi:hypothetical protein
VKTIYKYPLRALPLEQISIPGLDKILSIGVQDNQIVLYAIVDQNVADVSVVEVFIFGTGHQLLNLNSLVFLGTANLLNGKFMFHVFYKQEVPSGICQR